MPFYPFLGEGSPTKIDVLKKVDTLILTSLLEDSVSKGVNGSTKALKGSWGLSGST